MKIGEFMIALGLDPDLASFAAGESAVQRIWQGLATLVIKAKEATTALVGFATETAEYANSIGDASQKTGVGVMALQELVYAAQYSDLELGDLTVGLKFLSGNMVESADAGSDAAKAMSRVGVSARDASGKIRPTEDVLLDVADAFRAMPDGANKAALATQLFGKRGIDLIPLLNKGRDALRALGDEGIRNGSIMSASGVAAGGAAADGITSLQKAWTGLKRTIGAELLPDLVRVVVALREWIIENRRAIASSIRTFLVIVAKLFWALWSAISAVVRGTRWAIDHWRLLATVLGSVVLAALILHGSLIAGLIVEYAALGLAALVNGAKMAAGWMMALGPLALLAAAIFLVVKYWDDVKAAAGAVYDFIKGVFSGLFTWIEEQVDRLARLATRVRNFLAPSAAAFAEWAGPEAVAAAQQAGVPGAGVPAASGAGGIAGNVLSNAFGRPRAPVSTSNAKTVNTTVHAPVTAHITAPAGSSPQQMAQLSEQIGDVISEKVGEILRQAAGSAD